MKKKENDLFIKEEIFHVLKELKISRVFDGD